MVFLSIFTSLTDGLESLEWGRIAFFLFLALGVSFLCSLLEAIILSVTWSYIEVLGKDEKGSGTRLKKLKENLEKSVFEREKSPNPYSDYGTNR